MNRYLLTVAVALISIRASAAESPIPGVYADGKTCLVYKLGGFDAVVRSAKGTVVTATRLVENGKSRSVLGVAKGLAKLSCAGTGHPEFAVVEAMDDGSLWFSFADAGYSLARCE